MHKQIEIDCAWRPQNPFEISCFDAIKGFHIILFSKVIMHWNVN
jgi:hypothetical protein